MNLSLVCIGLGIISVVGQAHSHTIRQCTCKELDVCLQKETSKFEPCAEQCLHKLIEDSPQFEDREEEGKKCFQWDTPGHIHCYEEIKESTCTKLKDHKIPLDSTIEFFHQLWEEKNIGEDSKHTNSSSSSNSSSTDLNIINVVKLNFGENGHTFANCVRLCFTSTPGTCTDGLGCGVKRPPLKQWRAGAEKCKRKKSAVRRRFCNCLTAAGIGQVYCKDNHLQKE